MMWGTKFGLYLPSEELVDKNNYDLDLNSAHIFYPSTRAKDEKFLMLLKVTT